MFVFSLQMYPIPNRVTLKLNQHILTLWICNNISIVGAWVLVPSLLQYCTNLLSSYTLMLYRFVQMRSSGLKIYYTKDPLLLCSLVSLKLIATSTHTKNNYHQERAYRYIQYSAQTQNASSTLPHQWPL